MIRTHKCRRCGKLFEAEVECELVNLYCASCEMEVDWELDGETLKTKTITWSNPNKKPRARRG